MNIEEYRAMKAQMEKEAEEAQQEVEQPTQPEKETPQENKSEEAPDVEEAVEEKEEEKPITVEIDGKEVSLDELKNGYLRQSDYTKKTQELSRQRNETKEAVDFYEYLKKNPNIAQQIQQNGGQVPDRVDPSLAKVKELEDKMYDMILEKEIETLQSKYDDFEAREVLEVAASKGIVNLEDAYFLTKATKAPSKASSQETIDVNKVKEDLRKEILKELEEEKDSTQTIISTNSQTSVNNVNVPEISKQEAHIAKMMGMDEKEYIKWRDAK